jgi:hypothetical protein
MSCPFGAGEERDGTARDATVIWPCRPAKIRSGHFCGDGVLGKRSPPGTKNGSPPVMGILFTIGGKDPRQPWRADTGRSNPVRTLFLTGLDPKGGPMGPRCPEDVERDPLTPAPRPRRGEGGRANAGRDGTRTPGRGLEHWDGDSNTGTGLERWDGTRTLGRDSNAGTGRQHWDGTPTLGRDTSTGTGHEHWDGTRTLRRDANAGTGREHWDGTRTLGRDANTGTGREHWDGTRTLGRDANTGTGRVPDWVRTPRRNRTRPVQAKLTSGTRLGQLSVSHRSPAEKTVWRENRLGRDTL